MQRAWNVKNRTHSDLIKHLLEIRGITDEKQAEDFLNADYDKLHSPFLFKDMEKAVARIWQAVENKEKILIYSDYDADAITANAVISRCLKFLGVEPLTYIPDRFSEGYGLNLEAFEKIKEMGATVVITVDCGTNSTAEAEYCAKNGIDLIITDHHEITGDLPKAYALINPKNPNDNYPYRELTGVGVAFKLACGILSKGEKHGLASGYEKWLLDLVAIGTVADCHSLLGENRILVKYGLKVLAKTKWPGLREMLRKAGLIESANSKSLDTYCLGFILAPRINAAGRVEHASSAFDCLICDDELKAPEFAENLNKLNSQRQMLTETVMSEARTQLAMLGDNKILLAAGKDWPKGVVGLVAGKLTEEFGKPVLVMERGELESTGSARSVANFNLVEALTGAKEHLVKYGGHAAAAGFTVKTENIETFYKNLLDYAESQDLENSESALDIDAVVGPEEMSFPVVEMIETFEPFGVDNYRPKFVAQGLEIKEIRSVGKENKHLQLTLYSANKFFKCIAFNLGKATSQYTVGDRIDVAFEFLIDSWNGVRNIKLKVIDLRKA